MCAGHTPPLTIAMRMELAGIMSSMSRKRTILWLSLFILALTVSCRRLASTPPVPTPSPRVCYPYRDGSRPGAPDPLETPTPPPTLSPAPTASATPAPQYDFEIITHPDGGLYVGDRISFEVIPPDALDVTTATLRILPAGSDSAFETRFAPYGIAGRMQATLYWVWDTSALAAGAHSLTLAVQPLGYTWTYTVTLGAAETLPPPEPDAHWLTRETDCCIFHYVSDTAAAREITATLELADTLADHATAALGVEFAEPMAVTLMPRVLGQGGFAANEMYISYLDRNYAGSNFDMVLHHEMVHILDARLGGEMRPAILVEGLAVYLTGGHYKPEAILPRAAALLPPDGQDESLGLGWYIPLRELSENFYQSQHEIGYIEAAALVEYMVDRWGWEAYSAFYRGIRPVENGGQADALDAALSDYFDLTLEELEADFLDALRAQILDADTVADVRLTVTFFDEMRRYQQIFDPSAYFRTAWLPDGPTMRARGLVADLLRHPASLENLALENLLVSADAALDSGDPAAAADFLEAVTAVLDAVESGQSDPFDAHPLAAAYFAAVHGALERGFQAEKIEIDGDTASVTVSDGWGNLQVIEMPIPPE